MAVATPVQIRRKMSQSIINQGDTCLKRVEYDFFHDTPVMGGVGLLIGTGYHAGLAEGYLQRMHGDPHDIDKCVAAGVEAFLKGVEFDAYKQLPVDEFNWVYQPSTYRAELIELTADEASVIIEQLVRFYWAHCAWEPQYGVIAVEFSMDLSYPGAPEGWRRGGAVDLILTDTIRTRGGYVLDDHKTSRKKWPKKKGSPTNPQAAWYIDAWRTHANTTNVKFAYDVMAINLDPETKLADPEFERRWAPRNERQIKATLDRGRDLALLIERGGPFLPSPESFLCSPHYCDYWKICPHGSTLNFVDESEEAPF